MTFPEDFGTIPLMPAERLETAQTAVRAFDIVVIVLIVLAVALVALALWLSGKRLRMVVFLAIGTIVAFVLARLFTNAATDALTTGSHRKACGRHRVDPRRHPGRLPQLGAADPHRHRDHRDPGLPVRPAVGLEGVIQHASHDGADRARLIALVVLWIAVGLEVALLAAVLIIGLELVLGRDQGDSGEADPPSTSMPYTPIPPPRRPRPANPAGGTKRLIQTALKQIARRKRRASPAVAPSGSRGRAPRQVRAG